MRGLVLLVLLGALVGCGSDDNPTGSGGANVEFVGGAGDRYWFENTGSEIALDVRATINVCTITTTLTNPPDLKPGEKGYIDNHEDRETCGWSVDRVTWH